jgi:hypothetical protein
MTVSISGTGGVTFNDSSVQDTAATGFGFKNRIINGAMVISQRGTSSTTITDVGAVTYTVDRWLAYGSSASKFSVQQNAGSITPAVGFSNYYGVTSLAATSVAAGDLYYMGQFIEGFNFADMAWGTANARTVTLSFQVYSSLTGTFGGALTNSNNTRSYPFSYSIPTANTWTSISVTVAGDTTGTWVGATNGAGLKIFFGLGMGSNFSGTAGAWAGADYRTSTSAVQVVATNGATFYITGVQLEKGSTATSFDYRPYGTELALCQRYAFVMSGGSSRRYFMSGNVSGTTAFPARTLPVTMRAAPSISVSSASHFSFETYASNAQTTSSITLNIATVDEVTINANVPSAPATGGNLTGNNAAATFTISAEL